MNSEKPENKEGIPEGNYCYRWTEAPSEYNNFMGSTEPCPFFGDKNFNGVNVPWCCFLNKGGLDNRDYGEDYDKLLLHFGDEAKLRETLPLDLLWDGVKECGVNA